jgi:hypothetical protein
LKEKGHAMKRVIASVLDVVITRFFPGTAWSLIVCAPVFGGALLRIILRCVLPEHHLSVDSNVSMNQGMDWTGTMSGIALLVASTPGKCHRPVVALRANFAAWSTPHAQRRGEDAPPFGCLQLATRRPPESSFVQERPQRSCTPATSSGHQALREGQTTESARIMYETGRKHDGKNCYKLFDHAFFVRESLGLWTLQSVWRQHLA